MTPLSGVELQAARKAAAERFEAIVRLYVLAGYTIEYRKSLSGCCCYTRKVIQAPRPVTRKALYIFLHECAHATLGHNMKLQWTKCCRVCSGTSVSVQNGHQVQA
jgi:hypothetical protein